MICCLVKLCTFWCSASLRRREFLFLILLPQRWVVHGFLPLIVMCIHSSHLRSLWSLSLTKNDANSNMIAIVSKTITMVHCSIFVTSILLLTPDNILMKFVCFCNLIWNLIGRRLKKSNVRITCSKNSGIIFRSDKEEKRRRWFDLQFFYAWREEYAVKYYIGMYGV